MFDTCPILAVTLRPNGWLVISSLLRDTANQLENLEITLSPGESFGGHLYEEWCFIANGAGHVAADWLDV